MQTFPLDFMQCPACSHVWNRSFTYDDIPYQTNPNRMFNKGGIWNEHLTKVSDLIIDVTPPSPVVIDVGCGEGHFVRGLSERCEGNGRFIGFDRNASAESGIGIEFHPRLFEPLTDMAPFAPDIIVMRHVIEHLTEPASFVEELAWGAAGLGKQCLLFAESPCIDRVFPTRRLADFYYEHVSHFTTGSFEALLNRGGSITVLDHGYDGEVIYALLELGVPERMKQGAADTAAFEQSTATSIRSIGDRLKALAESDQTVAIWGGTGKAAAFINFFDADAVNFPLVVDSDPDKVDTYVPGTGQRIAFRDELKDALVDVIIIPTQWRARDIMVEMEREGISAATILIEHEGQLIDFNEDDHPYG